MKKMIWILAVLILAGCSSGGAGEGQSDSSLENQLAQKEAQIDVLENQVDDLVDQLTDLQMEVDAQQMDSPSAEGAAGEGTSPYLCEDQIPSMKYENASTAQAVLQGWFVLQPDVRELQGSFPTQFWDGVKSNIFTIRYISEETGLSTTTSFMIFIEEAGWTNGLLWMDEMCWLDHPGMK